MTNGMTTACVLKIVERKQVGRAVVSGDFKFRFNLSITDIFLDFLICMTKDILLFLAMALGHI